MMLRTLFSLSSIHSTLVADGAHQTSALDITAI